MWKGWFRIYKGFLFMMDLGFELLFFLKGAICDVSGAIIQSLGSLIQSCRYFHRNVSGAGTASKCVLLGHIRLLGREESSCAIGVSTVAIVPSSVTLRHSCL